MESSWEEVQELTSLDLGFIRLQDVCVHMWVCVYGSKKTVVSSQNTSEVNFSNEPWLVWSRQTFDLKMKKSVIHVACLGKKENIHYNMVSLCTKSL